MNKVLWSEPHVDILERLAADSPVSLYQSERSKYAPLRFTLPADFCDRVSNEIKNRIEAPNSFLLEFYYRRRDLHTPAWDRVWDLREAGDPVRPDGPGSYFELSLFGTFENPIEFLPDVAEMRICKKRKGSCSY